MRAGVVVLAALIALAIAQSASATPAIVADRDCSDFSNQAAAQSYFVSQGGPAVDADGLDADGDGVACESLPCPCGSSSAPVPPPTPPEVGPGAPLVCGPNDPAGLRFVGLPSRVIIGRPEIFGVDDTVEGFVRGKSTSR